MNLFPVPLESITLLFSALFSIGITDPLSLLSVVHDIVTEDVVRLLMTTLLGCVSDDALDIIWTIWYETYTSIGSPIMSMISTRLLNFFLPGNFAISISKYNTCN